MEGREIVGRIQDLGMGELGEEREGWCVEGKKGVGGRCAMHVEGKGGYGEGRECMGRGERAYVRLREDLRIGGGRGAEGGCVGRERRLRLGEGEFGGGGWERVWIGECGVWG